MEYTKLEHFLAANISCCVIERVENSEVKFRSDIGYFVELSEELCPSLRVAMRVCELLSDAAKNGDLPCHSVRALHQRNAIGVGAFYFILEPA